MTLWARLTWQAAGSDRLAADLARLLGVQPRPGGLAPGTWIFDFGAALLEVRPWVREGPSDEPKPWGRLVLEPVPGGEPSPDDVPGDTSARVDPADGAFPSRAPGAIRLAAVGWATVDADRADAELDTWLGAAPDGGPEADADPHLGATVRLRRGGSLPGDWLAFLEPATEGRAAASLARHGEGPCALYLHPSGGLDAWRAWARDAGLREWAGEPQPGPLGLQVALAGVPAAGPHLLVVERGAPPTPTSRTGTIRL